VSSRDIPDKYILVVGAVLLVAGLAGMGYSLVVLEGIIREVSEALHLAPRLGLATGVVALLFASALVFALGLLATALMLLSAITRRKRSLCF
jgi:hypothetical protein